MSQEQWKPRAEQCILDKKKLDDCHLAIIGDPALGVLGLVKSQERTDASLHELKIIVYQVQKDIKAGFFLATVGTWVGKFMIGLSTFITGAATVYLIFKR